MKMDIVSVGEILIDMFPVEIGRKLGEVSAFLSQTRWRQRQCRRRRRQVGREKRLYR